MTTTDELALILRIEKLERQVADLVEEIRDILTRIAVALERGAAESAEQGAMQREFLTMQAAMVESHQRQVATEELHVKMHMAGTAHLPIPS